MFYDDELLLKTKSKIKNELNEKTPAFEISNVGFGTADSPWLAAPVNGKLM